MDYYFLLTFNTAQLNLICSVIQITQLKKSEPRPSECCQANDGGVKKKDDAKGEGNVALVYGPRLALA